MLSKKRKIFIIVLFGILLVLKVKGLTEEETFALIRNENNQNTLNSSVEEKIPIFSLDSSNLTNISSTLLKEKVEALTKEAHELIVELRAIQNSSLPNKNLTKAKIDLANLTNCLQRLIQLEAARKSSQEIPFFQRAFFKLKIMNLLRQFENKVSRGAELLAKISRDVLALTPSLNKEKKLSSSEVNDLFQGLTNAIKNITERITEITSEFYAIMNKVLFEMKMNDEINKRIEILGNKTDDIHIKIDDIQKYLSLRSSIFSTMQLNELTEKADSAKGKTYSLVSSLSMLSNPDKSAATDPFASSVPTGFTLGMQHRSQPKS